jgi:hypothetical protein
MVIASPGAGRAAEGVDPRLSVGGGIEGSGVDAELTVSSARLLMFGPHLSLGRWAKSGTSYWYGELAGNFVLTVGLGLGRYASVPEETLRGHFVVGLPIPIVGISDHAVGSAVMQFADRKKPLAFLYVEPYWREIFGTDRPGWEANFGISLRLNFAL